VIAPSEKTAPSMRARERSPISQKIAALERRWDRQVAIQMATRLEPVNPSIHAGQEQRQVLDAPFERDAIQDQGGRGNAPPRCAVPARPATRSSIPADIPTTAAQARAR